MLHLYGVVRVADGRTLGRLGRDLRDVRLVSRNGLAIAVSEQGPDSLEGLPREQLVGQLIAHQSVLEELMGLLDVVIPLRFGAAARDDAEVRAILAAGCWQFQESLARHQGMAEFEIAAYWPSIQPILARIAAEPEVMSLKRELTRTVTAFEDKVRLGRLVKERLDRAREAVGKSIAAGLVHLGTARRDHPIVDEAQIATVSLLLPRQDADAVRSAVAQLDRALGGQVGFRLIGPLPPHSFCTLDIRRPDPDRLAEALAVLELPDSFNSAQLQVAFRRQVAVHHPDRDPGAGSQARFLAIQEAYRLLSEFLLHAPVSVADSGGDRVFMIGEGSRAGGPDVRRFPGASEAPALKVTAWK